MQNLREIIRRILLEEEILAEPDETNQEEHDQEEQSVAGIAGATTPLGTGPTYPDKLKKKHKKRQKNK
jgi:hypothetical protein